jgi:outer membrane protein assembly factor BamB
VTRRILSLAALLLLAAPAVAVADKPAFVQTIFPSVVVWTADVAGSSALPPAYDALHAYVPLASGELTAFRLEDGQVAWWVAVVAVASPVPGGGRLFVPEEGIVTALEAATGMVAWRAPLGGRLSAPPIFHTGWLIVGLQAGDLLALRADTGEVMWRQKLGATMRVAPAIGGDRLYAALDDKRILALELTTGKPVWEQRLPDVASQPLPLGDRVYAGSRDNFFYCLAANTGRIAWKWRAGADVIGPPVVDEERVYFTALDNVVRALDLRSGNQRWRRPLPIRPGGPPLHAGAVIIVSGRTLDLRAFFLRNGAPAGRFSEAMDIVGAPFFRPGTTTELDRLYVLTYSEDFALRLTALGPWREPAPLPLDAVPGAAWLPDPPPPAIFPTDVLPVPWLSGDPPPVMPSEGKR